MKNPNFFGCDVGAVYLLLHQIGQIWELVDFSTALIYLSGMILTNIKNTPGSTEKALQFDYRKKVIGPEMMSQKIGQMIVHVQRDNV
jgi:hypothetical protein